MTHVQQQLSEASLANVSSVPSELMSSSWTGDETKFKEFEALKHIALGNCRLLYGSERSKFYDIVLGIDEDEVRFCAALVCSRDSASKVLRTSFSNCPVDAIRTMVDRLQKESMPFFMAYGAGFQMMGQQGYVNPLTEKFELTDIKRMEKPAGPVDDTDTLPGRKSDSYVPYGAPRGPRYGNKRARANDDRMIHMDDPSNLEYGEP